MSVKGLFKNLKTAVSDFGEDQAMTYAAAVAFYMMLSLAPLLVILVTAAGLLGESARGQLTGVIDSQVGPQAAKTVDTVLERASQRHYAGVISLIIGVALLLFSATGVFVQLQSALNRVWDVKAKGQGVWGWIRTRLASLLLLFGILLLIFASIIVTAGLRLILPDWGILWYVLRYAITFAIFIVLFGMIFRILPDVNIEWRDVWVGSLITTGLFIVGQIAIGFYFSRSTIGSAYGAAGSLVVLLVWLYYSSVILFFGAELTQVYAHARGARITPNKNGEWVERPKKHQDAPSRQTDSTGEPHHGMTA